MNEINLLQIKEFSILTGISKDNLRFYDKAGLLVPEIRGQNGYRYYNQRQLDTAFLISDLRALGVSLPEIKAYADDRTPNRMLELFKKQDTHIKAEIQRLRAMQELMQLHTKMVIQAMQHEKNVVVIEEKEREPIFLCPPVEGKNEEELVQCYDDAAASGVNISFPIGAIITSKTLKTGDWEIPTQYYFKVRKPCNGWKPKGTYAVFYGKWIDDSPKDFYRQLFQFIRDNGLRICGDAYEESPLDALCTHEGGQYGYRVEVPVEDAKAR